MWRFYQITHIPEADQQLIESSHVSEYDEMVKSRKNVTQSVTKEMSDQNGGEKIWAESDNSK